MTGKKLFIALAIVSLAVPAVAADYDPEYLEGTWSLEGRSGCRADDAERVVFSLDGAFRVYNNGRLESAGFWVRQEKIIVLHLVSSVHRLDPDRTEFEHDYTHVVIDALPIRQQKNEFEVVARVEGELEHIVLNRCS